MSSKQVLNRQVQILENALKDLTKAHNKIIDDINKNTRCKECAKVKVEYAKRKNRDFNILTATLLRAFTHTDYSEEPYKLFEKE